MKDEPVTDMYAEQLAARKPHGCPACGAPSHRVAFRPHFKHGDCTKCLRCGVFVVGEDDGLDSGLVWNRWAINCKRLRAADAGKDGT